MNADFIDADAVARLIGLNDRGQFLRRRAELESDHGFPRPMPTLMRPLKWRREMVAAWVEETGRPDTAPPLPQGDNVVLFRKAAVA